MSHTTFKVDGVRYAGSIDEFQIDIRSNYFDTEAEARAAHTALKFPKYANVRVGRINVYAEGTHTTFYHISGNAVFQHRKDNDKNEAGEKRVRAMAKALAGTPQVRPDVNWKTPLTNEELNSFGFQL